MSKGGLLPLKESVRFLVSSQQTLNGQDILIQAKYPILVFW